MFRIYFDEHGHGTWITCNAHSSYPFVGHRDGAGYTTGLGVYCGTSYGEAYRACISSFVFGPWSSLKNGVTEPIMM